MSLGSRSGVNWIRRAAPSIERASALASIVLPTPGTSSMSTWPSASSTVRVSLIASGLPSMTASMAWPIRRAAGTRSSSGLRSAVRCQYHVASLKALKRTTGPGAPGP